MKMKHLFKIFAFVLVFFSVTTFAGPSIFPVSSGLQDAQNCSVATDAVSTFCVDFKNAVQGCCPLGKLPMQQIYHLMIATYGTLQTACAKNAAKYGGTAQACIDQWNCYWNGGKDSQGNLCDADGNKCESL